MDHKRTYVAGESAKENLPDNLPLYIPHASMLSSRAGVLVPGFDPKTTMQLNGSKRSPLSENVPLVQNPNFSQTQRFDGKLYSGSLDDSNPLGRVQLTQSGSGQFSGNFSDNVQFTGSQSEPLDASIQGETGYSGSYLNSANFNRVQRFQGPLIGNASLNSGSFEQSPQSTGFHPNQVQRFDGNVLGSFAKDQPGSGSFNDSSLLQRSGESDLLEGELSGEEETKGSEYLMNMNIPAKNFMRAMKFQNTGGHFSASGPLSDNSPMGSNSFSGSGPHSGQMHSSGQSQMQNVGQMQMSGQLQASGQMQHSRLLPQSGQMNNAGHTQKQGLQQSAHTFMHNTGQMRLSGQMPQFAQILGTGQMQRSGQMQNPGHLQQTEYMKNTGQRQQSPHMQSLGPQLQQPENMQQYEQTRQNGQNEHVLDHNADLYEQQQAKEQARLLDRFKQLRQWQVQQQESLMRQQQEQLAALKGEQERIHSMLAKQRENMWGGSPKNIRKHTGSVESPNTTPPRSQSRSGMSNVPQVIAAANKAVLATNKTQPTFGEWNQGQRPQIQDIPGSRPPPSENTYDHDQWTNPDLHSDLESNVDSQSNFGEEGVYPLPDTASETSDQPASEGQQRISQPVVPTPVKEEKEQDKSPEKNGDPDDKRLITSRGASKTFEELLEEQLKMEEKPSDQSPRPEIAVKSKKRPFLKKGQGTARFGTVQHTLKTKKTESTLKHWEPPKQQPVKSPPRKIAPTKSPQTSPVHHPMKLQLKPSPKKPLPRTREEHTRRHGDDSMDMSYMMRLKKRDQSEEVEREELDEFELLEQFADDNASFSSQSSLVVKVISKDKARVQQPSIPVSPLTKTLMTRLERKQQREIIHESDEDDLSDHSVHTSDDSSSSSEEDSDEDEVLDETLRHSDEELVDDNSDPMPTKIVQRKVAGKSKSDAHIDRSEGIPQSAMQGNYEQDGEKEDGMNDFSDAIKGLAQLSTQQTDNISRTLLPKQRTESDSDEESEQEDVDDENDVEEKEERTRPHSDENTSHAPEDEFDDAESWGDTSLQHSGHITGEEQKHQLQNEGLTSTSVTGVTTTPPTSKLVTKLFPQLKPKPKTNPQEQVQQQKLEAPKHVEVGAGVQSKALRDKLAELENEIERFRTENAALAKLRKEREEGVEKLHKEMAEFEKQKTEELQRLQEFKTQETKKLKHERKVFEKYQKAARAMPDKKEREEIELLKNQLSDLQEDFKRKETRWTSSSTRLRDRVEALEKENIELKEEIKLVEKRRLELWQKEQATKKEMPKHREVPAKKSIISKEKLIQDEIDNVIEEEHQQNDLEKRVKAKSPPTKLPNPKGPIKTGSPYPEDTPRRQLTAVAMTQSDLPSSDVENSVPQMPRKTAAVRFQVNSDIDKGSLEYEEITHVDGKRIYKTGAREILFTNGTRKEISSDGLSIIVSFFNGDIKQIMPDQRVVYYYSEAQTTHTTYPDGLEIMQFPHNQIEKHYPDGTREITFPDQTIKYLLPNGTEESIFPDGTVIRVQKNGDKVLEFANGQRETHTQQYKKREFPDGTSKIVYPDGRQETRYANGRVRIKDKDGNIVLDKR